MKSNLLIIILLLSFTHSKAQLANGSIAPDFTLTDMNGFEHSLYQDYLDQKWIDQLRNKHDININRQVLYSLIR